MQVSGYSQHLFNMVHGVQDGSIARADQRMILHTQNDIGGVGSQGSLGSVRQMVEDNLSYFGRDL